MGGSVNVAIRFSNGESFCTDRWTNNIPHWFNHPEFFSGEERAREYMRMNRNADPVIDKYPPGMPTRLGSSEYGLILIDYMSKTILDNNTYCHVGRIAAISAKEFGQSGLRDSVADCVRAGIVHGADVHGEPATPALNMNEVEILAEVGGNIGVWRVPGLSSFALNTAPMTIEEFEREDWKGMKKRIDEIGFPTRKADGLNATLPRRPPYREDLPELEKVSREIFRDMKSAGVGGWDKYDGIPYEKLTPAIRAHLEKNAQGFLDAPNELDEFRRAAMFGTLKMVFGEDD